MLVVEFCWFVMNLWFWAFYDILRLVFCSLIILVLKRWERTLSQKMEGRVKGNRQQEVMRMLRRVKEKVGSQLMGLAPAHMSKVSNSCLPSWAAYHSFIDSLSHIFHILLHVVLLRDSFIVVARHVLCEKQGKINEAYKKLQDGWLSNGDKVPPAEFAKVNQIENIIPYVLKRLYIRSWLRDHKQEY